MKHEAVNQKRKDKIPYQYYRGEFKKLSLNQILENNGIKYDFKKNLLELDLLNETYYISYPSGEVDSEESDVAYPLKTLIIRYLMKCRDIPPTGKMINYREVPDGNLYYINFYNRCVRRLSFTFNDKFDELNEAIKYLDAIKLDLGDLSYRIKFMHNIYVDIILWRKDDEFPASSQILFSDNINEYFTAEDLAFVGDILITKLNELAFKK